MAGTIYTNKNKNNVRVYTNYIRVVKVTPVELELPIPLGLLGLGEGTADVARHDDCSDLEGLRSCGLDVTTDRSVLLALLEGLGLYFVQAGLLLLC